MIKSANQYPVHTLFSYEGNVMYRVPPYQREYSWYKAQWEDLFEDLVEADGPHFLGTIITLDQTTDALESNILHVIDGQQRLTTLTLLLAAVYSVLKDHIAELDEDSRTDLTNLGRQLVRKSDNQPRVTPQRQGHNLSDYRRCSRRRACRSRASGSRTGPTCQRHPGERPQRQRGADLNKMSANQVAGNNCATSDTQPP